MLKVQKKLKRILHIITSSDIYKNINYFNGIYFRFDYSTNIQQNSNDKRCY